MLKRGKRGAHPASTDDTDELLPLESLYSALAVNLAIFRKNFAQLFSSKVNLQQALIS